MGQHGSNPKVSQVACAVQNSLVSTKPLVSDFLVATEYLGLKNLRQVVLCTRAGSHMMVVGTGIGR